ncbi:hypothetical protein SAY87_021919 [Trapa incisa]|uniref:Non-specific serine/threonine protein kinase n=1 Tax=Trapa incisa TaxID=236973 RepID=A0AAN7PSM2_9MYRT|nr:hypothetical protein SAY87_021919 [Trapa incisa]
MVLIMIMTRTSFGFCHLCRKVSNPSLSVSGTIPEELWSLTHLTNLNLSKNVLTGPISSSIGNLTQMQYLLESVYFWLCAKRNVYTMGERKNLVGNNFTMINDNFSSDDYLKAVPFSSFLI